MLIHHSHHVIEKNPAEVKLGTTSVLLFSQQKLNLPEQYQYLTKVFCSKML